MSNILRGTIRAYDAATHTATVELLEAPFTTLASVPVSRALPTNHVAAGETAHILRWSDVGFLVLGTYGGSILDATFPQNVTASQDLIVTRDATVGRDLSVARDATFKRDRLAYNDAKHALYEAKTGVKTSLTSGTPVDILNFASPGGTVGSGYNGACAGIILASFFGKNTGGSQTALHGLWQVLVQAFGNAVLAGTVAQIGSSASLGFASSLALAIKAGATATLLTVQATVTATNLANTQNELQVAFVLTSGTLQASNYITPSMA